MKNKGKITLESSRNFAYDSSYLHLKSFAWKRDYAISQKLKIRLNQGLSENLL